MSVRSIFRYPGGKTRKSIQERILGKFPKSFKEYREPFVGGGGIYFAVNPNIHRRWINDIHPGLMSVYWNLARCPDEFIKKCKNILPIQPGELEVSTKKEGKKYNARLGEVFKRLALDDKECQALRYFFINRTVWAGRVNYNIPSRLYYSNPTGWNIVNGTRLEEAAKHIKGTIVTEGDYLPLLEASGEDVLIYLDPPYLVNTKMPKTDQQYQYNFSLEDHQEFAAAVLSCKHKVCISYDDGEMVRELFKGMNFHTEEWVYSGSSLSKKKTGKEVLITNY